MAEKLLSTGVALLDEKIEGFRTGDNVILEVDVGTPPHSFLRTFIRAALQRGDRIVYVSFDRSPATIVESLKGLPQGDIMLLDAFTEGKGRGERVFRSYYDRAKDGPVRVVRVDHPHRPMAFHDDFGTTLGEGRGSFIVVDSLTGMQELWRSEERVRAFYTHTCPRLFDTGAVAAWVLNRAVHSEEFRATVGHVAQVVLRFDPDGPALRVVRLVGRRAPRSADALRYLDDGHEITPR